MQNLGTKFLISSLPLCTQQEFAIAVVDMGTLCKAVQNIQYNLIHWGLAMKQRFKLLSLLKVFSGIPALSNCLTKVTCNFLLVTEVLSVADLFHGKYGKVTFF